MIFFFFLCRMISCQELLLHWKIYSNQYSGWYCPFCDMDMGTLGFNFEVHVISSWFFFICFLFITEHSKISWRSLKPGLDDLNSLPCLLFLVCLRDTFIPEGRKLRDPRRLYAPGRMYHIVERKFCRYWLVNCSVHSKLLSKHECYGNILIIILFSMLGLVQK